MSRNHGNQVLRYTDGETEVQGWEGICHVRCLGLAPGSTGHSPLWDLAPPQAGQQSVWDDGFLAFSGYFPLTCLVPEGELDFSQDKGLAVSGSGES